LHFSTSGEAFPDAQISAAQAWSVISARKNFGQRVARLTRTLSTLARFPHGRGREVNVGHERTVMPSARRR
jgi:hypothetical protein